MLIDIEINSLKKLIDKQPEGSKVINVTANTNGGALVYSFGTVLTKQQHSRQDHHSCHLERMVHDIYQTKIQ